MRKTSKGFTLIELLAVMAIIGLLLSVMYASFLSARIKGRDAKRKSDLARIQLALEQYYDDHEDGTGHCYPKCNGSACNLPGGVTTCSTVSGGFTSIALVPTYLQVMPIDPINTAGNTGYAYFYGRNFKKIGPSLFAQPTASEIRGQFYVIAARMEGAGYTTVCYDSNDNGVCNAGETAGFSNTNLNYLVGNE